MGGFHKSGAKGEGEPPFDFDQCYALALFRSEQTNVVRLRVVRQQRRGIRVALRVGHLGVELG